jgi:hypothetical protein
MENILISLKNSVTLIPVKYPIKEWGCELSPSDLSWLDKKHIKKALENSISHEDLRNYNNSFENVPEYDMANAGLIFDKLNSEISTLKLHITDIEQRLKKYTNGENHKRYYEKNKEKIKETGASYLQKLKAENPEKIKEYSHRAYLNQKEKKLKNLAKLADENNRIVIPA